MTKDSRRRILIGLMLIGLTVVFSAYGYRAPAALGGPTTDPTAKDVTFIKSPELSIEQKLDRLGTMDARYRVLATASVSAKDRSILWRAHTSRWMNAPNLSQPERDILKRAYDLEVPALYDKADPKNNALMVQLGALCTAGPKTFRDQRVRMAAMVAIGNRPGGPLPTVSASITPRKPTLWQNVLGLIIAPVRANQPICFCSPGGCYSCQSGCSCPDYGGVCDPSSPGTCGCSGAQTCSAYCALCS